MNIKIEDLINENEKIIWQDVPNQTCYTWSSIIPMLPIAILWLFFDGGFIYLILTSGAGASIWWFLVPFFALHLMPVWVVIGKYIQNKLEYPNVVYAITDKRVIIRDGVIGIDYKSIDYSDLDNINVNINILERIMKVGTVICYVENKNYNLISIPKPYEVFKILNKISFDVKTDINYPNAKRPEENPGYNTKYDKID